MLNVLYSQTFTYSRRSSATIKKTDEILANELDFRDIKFPVKIKDIHKIEKNNSIGIRVFGYENKKKHPIYMSKKCYNDKHLDLLLIGEKDTKHYFLITDFNTFMYDHTLHRG